MMAFFELSPPKMLVDVAFAVAAESNAVVGQAAGDAATPCTGVGLDPIPNEGALVGQLCPDATHKDVSEQHVNEAGQHDVPHGLAPGHDCRARRTSGSFACVDAVDLASRPRRERNPAGPGSMWAAVPINVVATASRATAKINEARLFMVR